MPKPYGNKNWYRLMMHRSTSWLLSWLLLTLLALPSQAQTIRREFWTGIAGSSVSDLTSSPNFPNNPSGVSFPNIFEGPENWADEYGTRFRGYLYPPVTGAYTFWISGDDNSILYLSIDESPSTKVQIASVATWTASREWEKEPNQRSNPISLEAGKRYYVEALHKEGGGGDNIAVAWRLPTGVLEAPIPGNRLSPFLVSTTPPSIITQPQSLERVEGESAVFQVSVTGAEPLFFQWQRNGLDLPGENLARLIIDPVRLDDDQTRFRCIISNPLDTVISDEVILTVRPETIPPEVLELLPPPGSTVRYLSQIEALFTEPVTGVSADDLLINGLPAHEVTGIGAGP
jgi:hypothetical protein